MLALHTCSKAVDTLSKSGKRFSCDFTIVIKEWETTSFCHYVPSNHILCGNYGNTLITQKTCHASNIMSVLDPIRITLLHALKFTAGTLMAMITRMPCCGIGSIVQHMQRSCSSSSNRDGVLLQPQGYEQRSFIESISGEESPSTSDCITLHDRYDLDSYAFHAVLSGETNERQRPLNSCVFRAMSSETDTTLHLMPH